MAKFSKWILNFCEADKCEFFSFEQKYELSINTRKHKAVGKLFFCSYDDGFKKQLVVPKCPKKDANASS